MRFGARGAATWLAALLLCGLPGPARAGWTSFAPEDGLAGPNVTAIVQDRAEDLWFGTYDRGLSRYDGARWTTSTVSDGLLSDNVTALGLDRDGVLWVGTIAGVNRFDGKTWSGYTTADGLAGPWVNAIAQDSSGAMWFGTTAGLSRLRNGQWSKFTTANGLPSNTIYSLLVDHSGLVWAGTPGGLAQFNGTRWRIFTIPGSGSANVISAIVEDAAGALWCATPGGVSRLVGGTWTTFTSANGLVADAAASAFVDRSGTPWFGAAAGALSHFDGTAWTTFTAPSTGMVIGGLQDPRGGIWLATSRGVARFDGEQWKNYDHTNGLPSDYVTASLVDHTGAVWVGSPGAGASRFDHGTWTTFTVLDGLASGQIDALCEDRAGAIWFGTGAGATRYDGASWKTYTAADGLPGAEVTAVAQDSAGAMWFGSPGNGVSRFDGTQWTHFTTADGLASDNVQCILCDHTGAVWFGTYDGGVSRYDGQAWRTFRVADGLAQDYVLGITEDRAGALWFATFAGASRWDGAHWTTFTPADGLAGPSVTSILQDRAGVYWFATFGDGVSRWDGDRWTTFTTADGLAANEVFTVAQDHADTYWFGAYAVGGLSRFTPDRVPPRTAILDAPPGASAARARSTTVQAAYKEAYPAGFSSSLDGAPWSPWSGAGFLTIPLSFPADGTYTLRVRSRDRMGNVDPDPAVATFEIDATPPAPIVAFPGADATLRGAVSITGTAADARFRDYTLEVRSTDGGPSDTLAHAATAVDGGALGDWNTLAVPDGDYVLRLSVRDTLGLTGVATVPVVVDNVAPFRADTSPARVSALAGGDVYTTDGRAHAYFPPRSFPADVTVTIAPDTIAATGDGFAGAAPFAAGYAIAWGGAPLTGAATLDLSFPDSAAVTAAGALGLYVAPAEADTAWRRLGGTLDPARRRIVAGLAGAGRYRLARGAGAAQGVAAAGALRFSPRVFSTRGTFAADHVDILFDLERSAPVTVQIHNRAGRLVRELLAGAVLAPGANVVRWDGRDGAGAAVEDGLYIAIVRTPDRARSGTVAVVR